MQIYSEGNGPERERVTTLDWAKCNDVAMASQCSGFNIERLGAALTECSFGCIKPGQWWIMFHGAKMTQLP